MAELNNDTQIMGGTPAPDSDKILNTAREMFTKINSAIPKETINSREDTIAHHASLIALGMVVEHIYAQRNIKFNSSIDQINDVSERQHLYDIARILAFEKIQNQ